MSGPIKCRANKNLVIIKWPIWKMVAFSETETKSQEKESQKSHEDGCGREEITGIYNWPGGELCQLDFYHALDEKWPTGWANGRKLALKVSKP